MSLANGIKLNVGCGPVQPAGWVNIDNSYRARLASTLPLLDRALVTARVFPPTDFRPGLRGLDLERRLPWPDGAATAVYGGEILEHFTRESGARLIAECFRVLAPGGVIRMRVPDNARFWGNYLNEYDAMKRRPRAEWSTDHTRWIGMFFREICVGGRWGFAGHYHKWMYDEVSLILTLERAGFADVQRMGYHDSRIQDVHLVEVREDLIVEGVKPLVNHT